MTEFVVITGLSGAGRSTAANAFEDLGWFVIDNLPPTLIAKVAELADRPSSTTPRIALAAGTSVYFDELTPAIEQLRIEDHAVRVVFLDAADDVLVRRFEGTRRRHPLDDNSLVDAVRKERELMTPVKAGADIVIDTSALNVHQLRERILELFSHTDRKASMRTAVMSFGYKYGIPLDVDLVFDCRFLPNPHWIPELRSQTGLDGPVREYVMEQPETAQFLDRLEKLFELLLPAYVKEGKAYLTVAVGCTGGRHRSVVLAEEVAKQVANLGFDPIVNHRDRER